jgi:hypothetical protein
VSETATPTATTGLLAERTRLSEELSEAIPPAYTEFIGTQLMAYLNAERDYEDAAYVGINE